MRIQLTKIAHRIAHSQILVTLYSSKAVETLQTAHFLHHFALQAPFNRCFPHNPF
jgi:hypothetical protein